MIIGCGGGGAATRIMGVGGARVGASARGAGNGVAGGSGVGGSAGRREPHPIWSAKHSSSRVIAIIAFVIGAASLWFSEVGL